jgi:adenosylcobinamide-GDP ribazoletransferase
MNNFIDGIKYGLSYFTIFPIKLEQFEADNSFYKGVLFSLPLVGFLISLVTVLLYITVPFPEIYGSIFFSIFYLFLNGFIHLEAVCDTIDGYFASFSNKDVYKIIKEPHIGAIGAIGTFCFVLFKIIAVSYLLYNELYILVMLALVLSRATVFFSLDFDFHKDSYFINSLKKSIYINKVAKIVFFPIHISTKIILTRLKKQLGFLNGDTIGFNIELNEIILLNLFILLI